MPGHQGQTVKRAVSEADGRAIRREAVTVEPLAVDGLAEHEALVRQERSVDDAAEAAAAVRAEGSGPPEVPGSRIRTSGCATQRVPPKSGVCASSRPKTNIPN